MKKQKIYHLLKNPFLVFYPKESTRHNPRLGGTVSRCDGCLTQSADGVGFSRRNNLRTPSFILLFLLATITTGFAQTDYFFPNQKFNPAVPSPEQFLGYRVGQHQTRYDRLVAYLYELARTSDRVRVQTIGQTNELRPHITVTFSSATNLAKLSDIQKTHLTLADPNAAMPDVAKMPVVVQLGANVHGNETSGGEAMILAAYYLAACTDDNATRLLNEAVVLMEPVLNPDGRDRFVNWVNMHKASPLVADPNDREHNEVWPGGRTNHYWFDLNRDWYLAVHVESQNRLKWYHSWLPNVVTDHHEMGTNSTFFFEPSKENAENPLVPPYNYKTLNSKFAKYFEQAMNDIGSLYYTKESFDNLYPGYGSSYPDMQGGLGILFEQGSSRGFLQESQNGPLTFAFTIRNQLVNALATCKAALDERQNLLKFQREFYASAITEGNKNPTKAYVIGDGMDATRVRKFVETMLHHRIECYQLSDNLTIDGKVFGKGKAIVIPTAQPQYRLVQSVFERPTKFADSLFYDSSAWNLALAFGLPHAEIKTPFSKGSRITDAKDVAPAAKTPEQSAYAYLIDYTDFNATKALYQLLDKKLTVKVALKPFKIGDKTYGYGTLLIPVQFQDLNPADLFGHIQTIGAATGVAIVPIATGFSQSGIDLGSNNFQKVTKPEALLVVGQGVSVYEAGEVWYWLDTQVGMPISKVELSSLGRLNLSRYNVIVMVSGQYPSDKALASKLKQWVNNGGTLITTKTATEWAIRNDLTREKLRLSTKTDSLLTARRGRINYEDAVAAEGSKSTGGSIYEADLDITHPLGFGYSSRKIALYRNNNTFLGPSTSPSNTVVLYAEKPLLTGYVHPQSLRKISASAGILAHADGAGRIILFADNPNFRGIWYGTNKLFLNALFFGPQIVSPIPNFAEKD
ncbi:MAG: zinc carboxypeptidase [Runella sp.]|nr:MAG: zinc carboxypeptidase [Runella sp.]